MRQNLNNINETGIDYVLILSGDQLYRMNFAEMLATHQKKRRDVTISAKAGQSNRCQVDGHYARRRDRSRGRVP